MKNEQRRARRGRLAYLALSVAAGALLMAAGEAAAEVTPTEGEAPQDDAVVVTGLRKGLQDSLTLKKRSTSIVEAVSAEDIGKLPDASIAESLARLPGLAAQRVGGRSQTISIRGLSPDFSTTLLNGRLQVSSGDNRAAEFDQYPSEMVSSAIVYKTPDAAITGQGLSGTVVLNTIRPLDHKKRVISVNLRGSVNTNGEVNPGFSANGNRLSVAYIDQFMDGKLGVALSYAHLEDPSQLQHSKSWWWDRQGNDSITGQPRYGAGNGDVMGLHGVEAWATSREQVRDGFMAVLDFKPGDNFRSVNDFYYSVFDQNEVSHGAQWYQTQWTDDIHISNATIEEIGGSRIATGQTVAGVVPIVRNDNNTRRDEMFSFGSNNRFNIGAWRSVLDFGYSRSVRKESINETYAGYGTSPTPLTRTPDTIVETIPFGGFPQLDPSFDYADADHVYLGDAAPWGGWSHDGTQRNPKVTDQLTTARFSGARDIEWGGFKGLELGLDYSHRIKTRGVEEFDLCLKGWNQATFDCHGTRVRVADGDLQEATDISWAGFGSVLSYYLPDILDTYYDKRPIRNEDNLNKYWQVDEQLVTLFGKLSIDSAINGHGLRGNLGLQYVHATQTSYGNEIVTPSGPYGDPNRPAIGQWVSQSTSYGDFLPSLNLILDLDDDSVLRFGANRAMARPRMDDLRASRNAGVSQIGQHWSGGGGNPNLKPWIADGVDLSYERYFNKTSYIGVATFQKVLRTYIRGQTVDGFDFSGWANSSNVTPIAWLSKAQLEALGQPVPDSYPYPNGAPATIGSFSQPINGFGGNVSGLELSGAIDGSLIWDALDGFGAIGSFSRGWTNIRAGDPTDPAKLPGFSGDIVSATVYYEKAGFSARLNYRWRSEFLGETYQLFANRGATRILADDQVDGQISYEMQDGPLKGLTWMVQGYNLTNSNYQTQLKVSENRTSDGTSFPENYEEYGQTILFGFSYRFQ
ncbi:tonB-dependent receptor family protein [Asticcacaulis biprosthecium C19]|uniref:TonB-dependent receptor family protein n=1 Tax=Asticcacaulis biprosthecium C19 TaxID=715226 RepID=F4QGH4_9CAUL|nr:TonB-dependent receptor [Asticcacaulis biprosthecium]EGF93655.1 tonB-dependent receptor family protein [Asticcacaulis biprosthecium C19]